MSMAVSYTHLDVYKRQASGYLNETFLNSTSPYLSSSNSLVSFESFIATSVDNISPIRLAETDALGNICLLYTSRCV